MRSQHLLTWLYGIYFFFSAIPHTSAARYITLGVLVLTGAWCLHQCWHNLQWQSSTNISVGVFLGVALISSLYSPYPDESFPVFRKDFLTPGLLILLAGALPWTSDDRQRFVFLLIAGLGCGFAVKSGLAFWDGAVNHPWIFSPYSNPAFFEQFGLPKYVSFFAVDAGLYIPVILGAVLFWLRGTKMAWIFLFATVLAYGIVLVSGIRSAFLVASLGVALLLLIRYARPRHLLGLFLVGSISVVGVLQLAKTHLEVQRYVEIFKPDSYSKEKGMSDRYPIWVATYELIERRPLLGYGPGWQKIPTVARDTGLLSTWQADPSYYGQRKTFWFSLSPGQTNPHNLAMQLLFEMGWLGLLSYLGLLISLCTVAWQRNSSTLSAGDENRWLKVTVPVFLLCFLAISVTNGFLLPPPLVALLVAAAVMRQFSTASDSTQRI